MTDFQSILKNLQTSPFRAKFHLTKKDVEYIKEKGMEKIKSHAYDFVTSRLAPTFPKMTESKRLCVDIPSLLLNTLPPPVVVLACKNGIR